MIKRLRNHDGITLIELLATLAIMSIVSILIYGVLFNGINYSEKSKETVSIQQEMNILVAKITKTHESYASYDIVVNQNPNAKKIQLLGKDATGKTVRVIEISNDDYVYSLFNYKGNSEVPLSTVKTVNTSQPLYIKIIIKNKKKPNQTSEVKTIISRL